MKKLIDDLVVDIFEKREKPINIAKDIFFPNDDNYIYLIENYLCDEIYPDVNLFLYDIYIRENKELKIEFEKIFEVFFIIGDNEQGDTWFLSKEGIVFFYDHNDGEYKLENFQSLDVDFLNFLKICIIIKKYEENLDNNIQQEKFINELNSVKKRNI